MKIAVSIDIDTMKLWEAVWSADGAGITYWCPEIRDIDGEDINLWTPEWEPNPQDFRVYDQEAGEWHDVTLQQLANGYARALNEGARHCGTALDLNDPDSCFGDIVVQYAVFGEITYGCFGDIVVQYAVFGEITYG